jgi:LmbE family N-acetylglucosaminyl deacetylase
MKQSVLAIAAHPDDIEFVMAGTMLQLAKRGWQLHYLNIADGSRGSTTLDRAACAATRLHEAREAAGVLGATFYEPLCPDFEINYNSTLLAKVSAVVRQARPSIVLTHAPIDYMEDHEVACRLAVSAAFAHGMPNWDSIPPHPVYFEPVTVYHAQPHGNRTPMGEVVVPHFMVDTSDVMQQKVQSLECHACQKEWLDQSQGMDSYVQTMLDLTSEVGLWSGKFQYAEGWRRRQHWGFCGPHDDPLRHALADCIVESARQ